MDCSLPGFSIHGIFQARVLEWGAIASKVLINEMRLYFHSFQLWFLYTLKLAFLVAQMVKNLPVMRET